MNKLLVELASPAFILSQAGTLIDTNEAFSNDAALKQCQQQLIEHLEPYLNAPHKNLTCQFSIQRISLSLSQLQDGQVLVTCHRIAKRQGHKQLQQGNSDQSYFAILNEDQIIVCSSHPDIQAQREIRDEIIKVFDKDCVDKVSAFLDTLVDDDFAEVELHCHGKKYLFSAEPLDLEDRGITLVSWQTTGASFQPITGISQRYRYLLKAVNELSDGLIICDRFGQIVLLNHKVHSLFPYTKQKQFIGYPIERFVETLLAHELTSHPNRAKSILKWIKKKQKNRQAISFSFESASGHFLEYRDRLTEQDERIGLLIDSTKTKELNDRLEKAYKQTAQDSEAKSQFMAVMGHEIRTPLNAIIGLLELSINEQSQSENRSLKVAHRSAHHLLSLLNDVLDFTRFESDKVVLNQVPTDIRQLCEDVLITFNAQAQQHHFWLDLYVAPNVEKMLTFDDVRLTQVLHNLISNAIKFNTSEQPTALILVEAIDSQDKDQTLRISVLDNGIGISEEQQQRIFKGFMQASEETHRKFGGSGLGLSICQKICHLMNSELKVESKLGEGTHLYFDVTFDSSGSSHSDDFSILQSHAIHFYTNHPGFAHSLERYSQYYGFKVTYLASQELLHIINPNAILLIDFEQSDMPTSHHFHDHLAQMSQRQALLLDSQSPLPRSQLPHISLMPLKLSQLANLLSAPVVSASPIKQQSEPESDKPELWHIKLLIVEDNPDNIFVMKRQLETIGVQASFSQEPKEALKMFIQNEFDVVITDYQMPDLSGAELAFAMREHERQTQRTPSQIFVLTADRSEACVKACEHAEVDRMLAKPLSLNKLRELLTQINTLFIQVDNHATHSESQVEVDDLNDHFKDRDDLFFDEFDRDDEEEELQIKDVIAEDSEPATAAKTKAAATTNPPKQAIDTDSLCVDIQQIYEFTGDIDDDMLKEVVSQFLSNLTSKRQSLQLAVQIEDFSQVHAIAHSIKSSALYVGAKPLSQACQQLEENAHANTISKDTIVNLWQTVETEFERVTQFFESWKPSSE